MQTLTNQARKGETYYSLQILKSGKKLGYLRLESMKYNSSVLLNKSIKRNKSLYINWCIETSNDLFTFIKRLGFEVNVISEIIK